MFTLETCRLSIDQHYRPTLGRYSTDISADTRARYRPTLGLSVSRHVFQVGRPSVATIGRYLDGLYRYVTMNYRRHYHIGRLSVVYRSTFGGLLCIVNRFFC